MRLTAGSFINSVALYHQIRSKWLIRNNFLINLSLITRTYGFKVASTPSHIKRRRRRVFARPPEKISFNQKSISFRVTYGELRFRLFSINTANLIALNLKNSYTKRFNRFTQDVRRFIGDTWGPFKYYVVLNKILENRQKPREASQL